LRAALVSRLHQQVRNAQPIGLMPEIVKIETLLLDEQDAQDVSPLTV